MFGLDTGLTLLLIFCIICAFAFEFINGFHDTANAVATVIYTNSLKPVVAVIWSGIMNGLGVFFGLGVAMKIMGLLPFQVLVDTNIYHSTALILSILITAILWNLGTWYFGIPCSSSHTLVGAILGAGVGFSLVSDISIADGVKWGKAMEIGIALLVAPLVGFTLAVMVMFILKQFIRDKKFFKEPEPGKKPPFWTRLTLIATCTLVSFSHGRNDGQKGIGLVMIILIAFAPAYFAVNGNLRKTSLADSTNGLMELSQQIGDGDNIENRALLDLLYQDASGLNNQVGGFSTHNVPSEARFNVRVQIIALSKNIDKLLKSETLPMSVDQKHKLNTYKKGLQEYINYSPLWVIIMISLSLGVGTMIGWKRIVKTIGEKIGKEHLSYAQGASAELVAAATINASTILSLPVSTTHILSSGIAGSMVANKGIKNLQGKTVKAIAIAWLLTLPVTIGMACLLYILFRAIF